LCWHPVAAVQYTFTHRQYTEQHNCVDTRWQQYSTHLHTDSTQNNTIVLTPGGSSTVHICTQTVHRTTQVCWHPLAAIHYTFTHRQYTEQHSCVDTSWQQYCTHLHTDSKQNNNCVDNRWQQYSTHLHTDSTQNNTVVLTPGGSSTVHIYTQTVHRTT